MRRFKNSSGLKAAVLAGLVGLSRLQLPGAEGLDFWHWRNPLPSGNARGEIAYLNGHFVAITAGPGLLTSADGTNWTSRALPFEGALSQIIYANDKYVAVGSSALGGLIATSPDLERWDTQLAGTPHPLTAVTFGNGTFAAVGTIGSAQANDYGGFVVTSTNGTEWFGQTNSVFAGCNFSDIAYGNGAFVIAPGYYASNVLVSANAQVWTSLLVPNGGRVYQIAFTGNRFFATGVPRNAFGHTTAMSVDGTNWTPAVQTGLDSAEFHIVFGKGVFLGVSGDIGSPFPLYGASSDGVPLVPITPSGFIGGSSIAFGNGLFVSQNLQTSLDGTNWGPTRLSSPHATGSVNDLAFGNGVYVALGTSLLVSSNGLSFQMLTNLPESVNIRSVRFAAGLFHAVGRSGGIGSPASATLLRSTNGMDWVSRNPATDSELFDLDWGNGQWVAVGKEGTIVTSPNGNVWTLRNSGTAGELRGVVFGGNLYVAVGYQGTVLTSTDGNFWAAQFADTPNTLRKVAFGGGLFLAVGEKGTIFASSDGTNWSARVSGTTNNLLSVAFGDGQFCICEENSAWLLTSNDGLTWRRRVIGSFVATPSVADQHVRFFNGTFFLMNGSYYSSGLQNILQSGPVAAPRLAPGLDGGVPRVSFSASPGLLMRLESALDPVNGPWLDRGLVTNSASGSAQFVDPDATGQTQRFYRVVAP